MRCWPHHRTPSQSASWGFVPFSSLACPWRAALISALQDRQAVGTTFRPAHEEQPGPDIGNSDTAPSPANMLPGRGNLRDRRRRGVEAVHRQHLRQRGAVLVCCFQHPTAQQRARHRAAAQECGAEPAKGAAPQAPMARRMLGVHSTVGRQPDAELPASSFEYGDACSGCAVSGSEAPALCIFSHHLNVTCKKGYGSCSGTADVGKGDLRPSSSQKAMTSTGARSSGGAPDSCSTCQMDVKLFSPMLSAVRF